MARAKIDLSKLSINQLEALTGSTYRSIVKILSEAEISEVSIDDNCRYYDPKKALPAIFEAQGYRTRPRVSELSPDGDDPAVENLLDPAIQNARLARARTKKVEIENDILLKKLVPAADVEAFWVKMLMASKAKLRALPDKLKTKLVSLTDQTQIEEILETGINEALNELSNYDSSDFGETSHEDYGSMGSSSEIDHQ